MQPDFQVESRSYDHMYRGSWRGYRLDATTPLSQEEVAAVAPDCVRLWLPAGTPMHWATRTRPLRYNCLQLYWPERWYTLSAFYDDRSLIHTYASVIQPARFEQDRLVYVDLDLSLLIKPDLSYEVLTQAEFDQLAETLGYSEETRIGALLALETLMQSARLAMGLFASIPHTLSQTDFRPPQRPASSHSSFREVESPCPTASTMLPSSCVTLSRPCSSIATSWALSRAR